MRKWYPLAIACALLLCSCSPSYDGEFSAVTPTTVTTTAPTAPSVEDISVDAAWTDDDRTALSGFDDATKIVLADSDVRVQGDGATANGSVVTISKAGAYVVSGRLSNGQLRVETDGLVTVVLNGASIHSETTAPLFVKSAEKVIVTLADNTENGLSDGKNRVYEDAEQEEPNGTLFSKSDLTINGSGSLTVTAAFNDGIVSRDGLKIADGNVAVTAADDAVMGRDYVLIGGGDLTINAAGDGVKSTNDAGNDVGFVMIENGSIAITSEKDGVQAESLLNVTGGSLTIVSGGGSQNAPQHSGNDFGRPPFGYGGYTDQTTDSDGKALKAGYHLMIAGGTVETDAKDDALHSNGFLTINGGRIIVASGDDGLHADNDLVIAAGVLSVTKSYEGIEAPSITVNGGEVSVTASDDGFNASNGSTTGSMNPMASDGSTFIVNGGTVYIDAEGDGLDSNGTVVITGGTVYVNGPSSGGNGSLDFASSFTLTGGTLVAVGSLGMAETPTSNTMNSIVWYGCSLSTGQTLTVTASDGTVVAELVASRSAQWAYVSDASLTAGETYTITDGTSSQIVTLKSGKNTIGNANSGMGGMGGGGMGGRPNRW